MAKLSPLQRVQRDHTTKKALAKKVLELLDTPEGEDRADFEQRITTISNEKLLRLWDAHQKLKSKYGERADLVDKLVAVKFPNGNEPYRAKLNTLTVTRLLDLARQARV